MKKNFIFLFLIYTLLAACTYDFSPDNFIEIEKPSLNGDFIRLNNFNNLDTINIKKTLTYTFIGNNNQIRIASEVYLDNQQLGLYWQDKTGTFTIDPSRYEDGIHTIRIEHTFTSGSGSIADQAQMESLTEIVEYQFVVERKPSTPPEILDAFISDGTIYIKWDPDVENDFSTAYLSIQHKNREMRIPLSEDALAFGVYNDTSTVLYMGNFNTPDHDEYSMVTYSLIFKKEYEETYGSSKNIVYNQSVFKTKISFVDFNSYKIKWSSHPMFANFELFDFSSNDGYFMGSSEGGEYIMDTPYIFGKEYRLSGQPTNTVYSLPYYTFYDVPLDNETFGEFEMEPFFAKDILYNPNTKNFYALIIERGSGYNLSLYIYKYSEEMEYLSKSYIADYEGTSHEYLKLVIDPTDYNFYLDARSSAYKIDGNSLEILKQITYPNFSALVSFRGNILSKYSDNILTIYNTDTNTVIYSEPSTSLGYLSPSGEYVFIYSESGKAVYRIIDNQLLKVREISSVNYNYRQHSPIMNIYKGTLYYSSENQNFVVDLLTNVTKSFEFGLYQQSFQYDSFSKKLLVSENGNNAIYDMVTGELIFFRSEQNKNTSKTFSNEDRNYLMHLQNGRLIHSKGIYIDIN